MKKVSACLWCGSQDLIFIAKRKDGVEVLECQNCGLFMNGEIPEDPEQYYQEDYFNVTQTDFESGYEGKFYLVSPAFFIWQNSLVEEVTKGRPKSFLEIGAATGNLLEILKEYQPNLKISGIDISDYAVKICARKGLDVVKSNIEEYTAKQKHDIVFSSETMEHLDNLRSFLSGVAKNLKDDGTFIFYVPSISEKDARKEKGKYVRFNVNMEHLLHFSPEFFRKELPKFFSGNVLIKEFKTSFGPSIVGAVSKRESNLKNLEKIFTALDNNSLPKDKDKLFLKNLAIFSLKFAQFDLAEKTLKRLSVTDIADKPNLMLLKGLASYHDGDLAKAGNYFEDYLKLLPESHTANMLLLANEAELEKAYLGDMSKYKQEAEILHSRNSAMEAELNDLKHSKIVGNAIKFRHIVGATLDPIRNFKKKSLRSKLIIFIPPAFRPPLAYVVRQKWRIRQIKVHNQRPANGLPLVSVIIPYYNRAETIDDTLNSLKDQTYTNFEIIIVDDGSTEKASIAKLKKLDASALGIKIVRQANAGVAGARNCGISKARGQYIICLDSDDWLEATYIEKCVWVLETDPNTDIATTDMNIFGVDDRLYRPGPYQAGNLLENNMVETAAMFEKSGWKQTGGYKPGIGYEDWEYWVNLAENGYWGKNIPEPLFNYRTALSSRYVEDLSSHNQNIEMISKLHPRYKSKIRRINKQKHFNHKYVSQNSLLVNLDEPDDYKTASSQKSNILIAIPWMTFGGAETLILNFCNEVKNDFNLSFITGLKSGHEWEPKFKDITSNIYHLANLLDEDLYIEFISNYIKTRQIDILHVIHTDYMFGMLEELKRRHPKLKIAVTVFNDRAVHFEKSLGDAEYIDIFISDNNSVYKHYLQELGEASNLRIISNGINSTTNFNPLLYDRSKERKNLGIGPNELGVFFIGRLSEEKNPDVFVEVAKQITISNKGEGTKFFIIGDGPMAVQIKKSIDNLSSDMIVDLGYQSDIARFLSAADIFVLPSSIEGFPLSILEAMAMKVSVVASDVGAVAEVIKSGIDGVVVAPGDVDEIAKAVLDLKDNPGLLRNMKAAARKEVENKYSNLVLGRNYKALYRDLLK